MAQIRHFLKYVRLFDPKNKVDWESESHCIGMLKELNDVMYVRNYASWNIITIP